MSSLRIYRKFYVINNEVYTLITPSSLSAKVYNDTLSFLVESPIVNNQSIGFYYINISPELYNENDVYEIRWDVQYVSGSEQKELSTFFKYSSTGSITIYRFGEIDFDVEHRLTEIELKQAEEFSLEIIGEQYEIDISQEEVIVEIATESQNDNITYEIK